MRTRIGIMIAARIQVNPTTIRSLLFNLRWKMVQRMSMARWEEYDGRKRPSAVLNVNC